MKIRIGRLQRTPAVRRNWRTRVVLIGGPLDRETVALSSNVPNDVNTLPLAPMKGFPAGRYVNRQWQPLEP